MDYSEFSKSKKKVNGSREHSIKNSYGINDYYKNYRETVTYTVRLLDRTTFSNVFHDINDFIVDNFLEYKSVKFPWGLGSLVLYSRKATAQIDKNGKLIIKKPIQWDATMKLWFEDEEAHENKTLVRKEDEYVHLIKYSRKKMNIKNSRYIKMAVARSFKIRLRELSNNWENTRGYEKQ